MISFYEKIYEWPFFFFEKSSFTWFEKNLISFINFHLKPDKRADGFEVGRFLVLVLTKSFENVYDRLLLMSSCFKVIISHVLKFKKFFKWSWTKIQLSILLFSVKFLMPFYGTSNCRALSIHLYLFWNWEFFSESVSRAPLIVASVLYAKMESVNSIKYCPVLSYHPVDMVQWNIFLSRNIINGFIYHF